MAGPVLGRDQPQAQGADIGAAGQVGRVQHLRPGIDRVAGPAGIDVAAAVDRQDVQAVAEPVERQRPGQRDHHAAIDDAGAESALALGVVVEMDPGAVVVEAGGAAVLALHHAHAVDMVDPLADHIVLEEVGRAGLGRVDPVRRAGPAGTTSRSGVTCAGSSGTTGLGRRRAPGRACGP